MPPSPLEPVDATITPLPPSPVETGLGLLLPRQDSIYTLSITNVPSASATSNNSNSGQFPVAVAVPALIGGMALAILIAGTWWWRSKKKEKERRLRWERHQKRKRKRQEASGRPSISASRNQSGASIARQMMEKDHYAPPVPPLPKAHDPYAAPKSDRGYGQEQHQQQYQQHGSAPTFNAYSNPVQPDIDNIEQQPFQYDDDEDEKYLPHAEISPSESTAPLVEQPPMEEEHSTPAAPSRPSRSTKRIAAAENAAAKEAADPMIRYKPNKPSPLALKAAEEKRAAAAAAAAASKKYGDIGKSNAYAGMEMLAPEGSENRVPSDGGAARQISGEWGVALGSPSHDGTFQINAGHGYQAAPLQSHYLNDPYLSSGPAPSNRAPSGQYSTDPYAGYHDTAEYKNTSNGSGRRGVAGGGWV